MPPVVRRPFKARSTEELMALLSAVGTAILGIVLFGDPAGVARIACIGLIVAGIVGLKLVIAR